MLRFLRYLIEVIAAIVAIAIIVALLVAWRLSSAPITSDYFTPYIAAGIEEIVPKSHVRLGSSLISWDSAQRSILIHADDIKITNGGGIEIATVPSFDARISVIGMLFGQFLPRDLQIMHPQIRLGRTSNGIFIFGGVEMGGSDPSSSPDRITDALSKIPAYLSHSVLLHRLEIKEAVFDIHDAGTNKEWSVAVPEISVERSNLRLSGHALEYGGLDGKIIVEVTQKDSIASLNVNYSYNASQHEHILSSTFDNVTPAFMAGGHPETIGLAQASILDLPLSGKILLTFDKDFSLIAALAEIHGDQGHLVYGDFWDQPCPIKMFDLEAIYDESHGKLAINKAHLDFDGPTLDVKLNGVPAAQSGKDIDFILNLAVDDLPMNRFAAFWPKNILPDPQYWLKTSLREGVYEHGEAELKGDFAFNDLANLSITDGKGKMTAANGTVTYVDGMPAVEHVNATASFDLKKMDVQIASGGIGNVKIEPFAMQITGLADEDQYIDIPLQVTGPIPDIMRLIDHPPLGYAKALGLVPDAIGGTLEGTVHFQFPLLKTLQLKDLTIKAEAKANAVTSTSIVPGVAIDQGNLDLALDMSGLSVKGVTNLDKIPFQIAWQENFDAKQGKGVRHITIKGDIKDDQWSNIGISAFEGTKGPVNLVMDIDNPSKDKTLLTGTVDMTSAALVVSMIDWKKPENAPAILKFSANAVSGKPVILSSLALDGAQVTAHGDGIMSRDMSQLLSLNLKPFVVGRTNAEVHFVQSLGPQGALRFDVKGASLDVSGLRGNKVLDRIDPRPRTYHIQVNRLYTGDKSEIDKVQGTATRDLKGWSTIDLRGFANGDTPLSIELTPQPDGHQSLLIGATDFGKAMKGLDFTDAIRGGKLSITGQSTIADPRVVTGKANIGDFTVQNLPALALLLNAASPFGFGDILTDRAAFSRFESDFRWQGDVINLIQAHAAGSAVGINIDGKIDMNSGDAHLQGNLVPFSVMNNILNYIPVIGGLITGGKNQGVLAVAYQINGPLGSPRISVNPVSLLTPGFIRNLFFRNDAPQNDLVPEGTHHEQ